MTAEAYFDLCEELGSEPVDSEIPVDINDMPDEVQMAYHVYHVLPLDYDSMSGNFFGRDLTLCGQIMDIMSIEDKQTILKVLIIINDVERSVINSKRGK